MNPRLIHPSLGLQLLEFPREVLVESGFGVGSCLIGIIGLRWLGGQNILELLFGVVESRLQQLDDGVILWITQGFFVVCS